MVKKNIQTSFFFSRFGEGTTQRLPIEALGDRDLVDRLSKLPIDQQPFWLINWQALEDQRKNPQTYPQRPSPFAEPVAFGGNSSPVANSNSPIGNSGITTSPDFVNRNGQVTDANVDKPTVLNSELGNRNGQSSDESNTNINSSDKNTGDKVLSDPHFSNGNNYGAFIPLTAQKTRSNLGTKTGGSKVGQDSSRLQKMYERVY